MAVPEKVRFTLPRVAHESCVEDATYAVTRWSAPLEASDVHERILREMPNVESLNCYMCGQPIDPEIAEDVQRIWRYSEVMQNERIRRAAEAQQQYIANGGEVAVEGDW
jgi:transcription elongation factor Elf1